GQGPPGVRKNCGTRVLRWSVTYEPAKSPNQIRSRVCLAGRQRKADYSPPERIFCLWLQTHPQSRGGWAAVNSAQYEPAPAGLRASKGWKAGGWRWHWG